MKTASQPVWIKVAQALFLAVAVCFSVGASDDSARLNNLSHRLMCQCGCAQLVGECGHVGCPSREPELAELRDAIAAGKSDQVILDSFVAKYGAVVLAAPTTHGFDLVAWIAPFAVFLAALFGTILLVRHWTVSRRELAAQTTAAQAANHELDALREKIRRETGDDGGF
jgi:cytochrome c-type biogenesis protein CcmH